MARSPLRKWSLPRVVIIFWCHAVHKLSHLCDFVQYCLSVRCFRKFFPRDHSGVHWPVLVFDLVLRTLLREKLFFMSSSEIDYFTKTLHAWPRRNLVFGGIVANIFIFRCLHIFYVKGLQKWTDRDSSFNDWSMDCIDPISSERLHAVLSCFYKLPPLLTSNVFFAWLQIYNNSFTGTFPDSIGQWSDLTSFETEFNLFSGTLPDSIWPSWTKLEAFSVWNNMLEGSLSSSLGLWSSIRIFWLEENQFVGTLPDAIGEWLSMGSFDVSTTFMALI